MLHLCTYVGGQELKTSHQYTFHLSFAHQSILLKLIHLSMLFKDILYVAPDMQILYQISFLFSDNSFGQDLNQVGKLLPRVLKVITDK